MKFPRATRRDLATFEREGKAFFADEDALGAWRAGAEYVVQGTIRSELYEDAPMEFPGND